MKTKLPWLLAAFLGLVVVLSHAQNAAPAGSVSRFQLFPTNQGLYRLDTETGETFIYREGFLPEGTRQYRYNYWQRVDDRWVVHDPAEEARQALSSPR